MTAMRTAWSFRSPAQLTVGPGAVIQLGPWLTQRESRRAMLISDTNLTATGLTRVLHDVIIKAGGCVGLFNAGEPEPSIELAQKAIAFGRDFRPDAVIGLGGGSNMDLAKAAATVLTHGGRTSDYLGFDQVPGPLLNLVCVPTTAGTGSEVSHAAVLTDTASQTKVSIVSHHLRPALALVDPDLVITCPESLRADAGMDALSHAIEAFTATDYDRLDVPAGEAFPYEGRNPLGDCIAEKAISLIHQHLVRAVNDPDDAESRSAMCLAATLAGLAFSNCGVALVHALEYPLGCVLQGTHGARNAILLPHVMRFNLPERISATARLATLMGEDVQGLTEEQAAERAVEAVSSLRERVGIPGRIRDLGGRRDQLPLLAEKTFAIKRLLKVNPRGASYDDLLRILENAF
jgi:alcohol dehydrogenase class IV